MSTQPIDIAAVTFKLIFHNINKEYWIDPPIDWDKMPIELKRPEGSNYARVIKFGDGNELTFVKHKQIELGHQFDRLVAFHKLYADEAFIEFVLFVDGSELLRAELIMKDCKTDRLNYFTCSLAVNDLNKKIEDLEDTKIDVFGSTSLLNNFNEPAFTEDVILQPKKIRERAIHELGNEDLETMEAPLIYETTVGGNRLHIGNPFGLIVMDQSDVAESYYVPPTQQYVNSGPGNAIPDTYISGNLSTVHNLFFTAPSEVLISVKDVRLKAEGPNLTNVNTRIILQIAVITYDNEDMETVIDKHYVNIKDVFTTDVLINETISLSIPKFTRLIYEFRIYTGGATSEGAVTVFSGGTITADTIDIFPPSKSKMTRLIHAGKKILSNITENIAVVNAPRFEQNGEFWWYYITSGFFIRGFLDDSFDLAFKDWKEFIQKAFNCDVQISGNTIFIGKYEDFYTDQEIARIEFKPDLDNYEITLNKDLIKNQINIKYSNFESDKKDTIDAFHTESEWFVPKRNKGSLDLDLGFTADGYSIEYARREGINAEPTTAKSKDNDVYIVDCLVRRVHLPWPFNTYIDILQNRQNQGFEVDPDTVFDPPSIYNLRLSLKRLLLDHYGFRIAEIGQKLNNGFPSGLTEFLRNTFFKSNGNLRTNATDGNLKTYQGWITEKENVIREQLKTPIISPEIYNFTLSKRMKYNELINLFNRIINIRGYVTFYSEDGSEIKVHPFDMSYNWAEEELTIKAEKRYEI